jgi:hypothetical protein
LEEKNKRIFWAIFMTTFFAMFGETIPMSFQPQFISGLWVCAVLVFPITQAVIMESLPIEDRSSAMGVSMKKVFPEMFKETLEQLRGL